MPSLFSLSDLDRDTNAEFAFTQQARLGHQYLTLFWSSHPDWDTNA